MSMSDELWTRSSNARMFPVGEKEESRHWPLSALMRLMKRKELRMKLRQRAQSEDVRMSALRSLVTIYQPDIGLRKV